MKARNLSKLVLFLGVIVAGCGGAKPGELVGVSEFDGYTPITPFGMNYIKTGSYTMGVNDDDVPFNHSSRPKTVSIASFYIDDTEISNTEYRQFIYAVRDSLYLDVLASAGVGEEGTYFTPLDESDWLGRDYVLNNNAEVDFEGEDERAELQSMFIFDNSGGEQFYGKVVPDVRRLIYEYYWVDFQEASKRSGKNTVLESVNSKGGSSPILAHNNRKKFIIKEQVNVYPDTMVWLTDFTYATNEMMAENYFWHPAYDDYPLVGVTWSQARGFNVWRTNLMNNWKNSRGDLEMPSFRLPTEAEWEYAARGGLELGQYPWGGPYMRNRQGCPLANYKPLRGDYNDDGALFPVKVVSYEPNDYGLYCMAGNVAEWTNTAFDESVYEFSAELNPDYNYLAKKNEKPAMKRKVIRGGSWKDIPFFLQCGARSYEYQDTAKSYIGFRSVMSFLGRGQEPAAGE